MDPATENKYDLAGDNNKFDTPRATYTRAQKLKSFFSTSGGSKNVFITFEISVPKMGSIKPPAAATMVPSRRTGISGLLRAKRRPSGTGGWFDGEAKLASSSVIVVSMKLSTSVGKPREKEKE